jgi:Zn finger protein HypA/HybF involved in hydrogenase expression
MLPEYGMPMIVRAVLARLLFDHEPEVVVECRHCGTNLSPDADQCPNCESGEIAHHQISE